MPAGIEQTKAEFAQHPTIIVVKNNESQNPEPSVAASTVESLAGTDAHKHLTSKLELPFRYFSDVLRGYYVTDALGLIAGFAMAMLLSIAINSLVLDMPFKLVGFDTTNILVFLTIAGGCIIRLQQLCNYRVRMNLWTELNHLTTTLGFAVLVHGFFQFATRTDLSRLWLVSGWAFAGVFIIGLRVSYRATLRRKNLWSVPTLLVGGGLTADDTRAVLEAEKGMGFEITAQVRNLPEAFMQAGRSWQELCASYGASYVIIALDGREMDDALKPIAQLTRESVPFSVSPPRRNLPVLDMMPQYFFNSDVKLLTHNRGLEQSVPQYIKRCFDLLVASLALIIISPLLVVLAVLTKLDGGPVFYGHTRVGRNGASFACLKFRSMVTDSAAALERYLAAHPEAQAEWDADQKLKHDPRVTAVGRFLRKTSLDELPQLFNVLMGHMSLVGPRPIVETEISKYDQDIAHYYRVRPGITGLWQVSGRNDVSYAQRVHMDSWYVRNWSLWHDIAILFKTVPALLNRSGAY